jgi:hypothetical protein
MTTLCVTLSLTLFALGGADLIDGFCLKTLSFGKSTAILEPILDTIGVSLDVAGMMCEESGRRLSVYSALYYILQGFIISPPRLKKEREKKAKTKGKN